MGASSYICWEELNRPNLADIQLAEFKIKPSQSIRFLDLGYSPSLLGRLLRSNEGYASTMFNNIILPRIIWWPLICASSIKKNFGNGSFNEEYVVPQFLLQDPKKDYDYNGIRFISSKICYDIRNSLINTCFAFTAEDLGTDEYSPFLQNVFDISEIVDCNLIGMIDDMSALGPLANRNGEVAITDSYSIRYDLTVFYRIDEEMSRF